MTVISQLAWNESNLGKSEALAVATAATVAAMVKDCIINTNNFIIVI